MKYCQKKIGRILICVAFIFIYSCQENDNASVQKSGVEFIFSGDRVENAKSNKASNKNAYSKNGEVVESCDMSLASYAIIEMAGNSYKIDLKTWGNNYKTDLIELDPGTYEVTSCLLFDNNDHTLYATPATGSEFGQFVSQSLPFEVTVENYKKIEYDLEVLCIEDFTPPQFGFIFWEITIKQIKYLCVFANYCEPETGHAVASLEAFIYPNSEETSEDDLIWSGSSDGDYESEDESNELLCLKFPYDPSIPTEDQSYYIELFVNGELHELNMSLDQVDLINEEDGYLHLNEDCGGDSGESGCETAFALGNNTFVDLELTRNRWGWANEFTDVEDGSYTFEIWAGAGQNDLSKGTLVGTLTVEVSGPDITVTYDMNPGFTMSETHLYLGDDTPTTIAPGQYGNIHNLNSEASDSFTVSYSGDGDFWLIAHAVVCD